MAENDGELIFNTELDTSGLTKSLGSSLISQSALASLSSEISLSVSKAVSQGFNNVNINAEVAAPVITPEVDDTKVNQGMSKIGDFVSHTLANLASQMITKISSTAAEAVSEGIELASDMSEVKNVVDTTFGSGADKIYSWAETAKKSFGIGSLAAQQYTGSLGAMLKSSGVAKSAIGDMSTALVGLSGDMASFYNLDIGTAFEKIRSGISGETEPLKQLGINMSVANLEAYALAQGIEKSYNEMSQAEQVMLRYEYLLSVTSDAQGDFAKTADSFANQQRIAALNVDEMKQALGERLLPAAQDVITYFNDHADEITETVEEIGDTVADVVSYLLENKDECIAAAEGIGAGILAYKGLSTVSSAASAISALTTAITGATAAQTAFNAAAALNPILLIGTVSIAGATALASWIDQQRKLIGYEGEIKEAFNEANKEIAIQNNLLLEQAESDNPSDKKQAYDTAKEDMETFAQNIEDNNARLMELYNKRQQINLERDNIHDTWSDSRQNAIMAELNAQLDEVEQEIAGINEQNIFLESALSERRYIINKYSDFGNISPANIMNQDIIDEQGKNAQAVLNKYKTQSAAAIAAQEELDKTLSEKWSELDHKYAMGIISSESELYNKRLDLLEEYGNESRKEHYRYYEQLAEYRKSSQKEELKSAEDNLNDLNSLYKKKYDELMTQQNAYRDKLMSIGGSVFSIDTKTDDDGKQIKEFAIKDIDAQIAQMRAYHEDIKRLKAEGAGSALLNELTSLSGEDGAIMADYVASLSRAEREKIISLYAEKEAVANELAADMYAEEASSMQTAFISAMSDLGVNSYDAGRSAAEQFALGFNGTLSELISSAAYNYPSALNPSISAVYNTPAVRVPQTEQKVNVNVQVTGGDITFDGQKYGEYNLGYKTSTDIQKGR